MRAFFRRFLPLDYRLALIVRNRCSRELENRARIMGLDLKDLFQLVDEVESEPVTREDVERAELARRRSTREAVDWLRAATAP